MFNRGAGRPLACTDSGAYSRMRVGGRQRTRGVPSPSPTSIGVHSSGQDITRAGHEVTSLLEPAELIEF